MPTARSFKLVEWSGHGWRAVEAQHKNATLALVHGDLNAQAVLEQIIDAAKPLLPASAEGLHFLLSTAFRYQAPPPNGSRFRGRFDPAVFYGAEDEQTACAESGYWRLRFWRDSEGLSGRETLLPMTLFEFHGATRQAVDLTKRPWVAQRGRWTDPTNYAATQRLAADVRDASGELIRYESVRNSPAGRCLAILTPAVFKAVAEPYRHEQQGWTLFLQAPHVAVWQRNVDGASFAFRFGG